MVSATYTPLSQPSLGSTSKRFLKRQILGWSKLKEFTGDYFKFDESVGKFSEVEENAEGKGDITRKEQCLLFPQGF